MLRAVGTSGLSFARGLLEDHKRVRTLLQQLQTAIATHEFDKARLVSGEERKERDRLSQLRKKYKLDESRAVQIGREDIEKPSPG